MKSIFIQLFILLSVSTTLFSQENTNFHFKKIQVDDGLTENTIYCILQDLKGFIWFGTKDGLNRYDGSNFRIFRHTASNPLSLGNNFIRSIAEGFDNQLYIGTDDGLYIMDTIHETFTSVNYKTADGLTISSAINTLYIDKDKRLWIGTMYQGIFMYDIAKKLLSKIEVDKYNLGNNAVWTIYGDRSGTIWIGTRLGLLRYNPDMGLLEPVGNLFKNVENSDYEILSILEDYKGNLWLGTWSDGIWLYNRSTGEKTAYLDDKSNSYYITHVRTIFQYTDHFLLIGSDDGLYLFNQNTRKAKRIDIPQMKYSLSDQNIYSMARDREGGIWLGTYFGGVNYLNVSKLAIETYYSEMKQGMLSGKAVSQFCEDKHGNMWIATEDGGVNYLNVMSRKITQPIKTTYHNTHALLLDDDDLWIGTFSRGVDIYNVKTQKLTNFRSDINDEQTLNDDCVFSLYKTRKGDIYIGTPVGLNKYNRKTKSFSRIPEVSGFIYDIKEDEYSNLWLAAYGSGVIRLDAETNKWIYYDRIISKENPIVGSKLTNIHIDSQKRIIFSSEGRGIFIYDHQTDNFKNISEVDGLPNNVIYGVLDDPFGNLWVSCNKGIVSFHISEPGNYKQFDKEDGLQSNQFNYKSSYKASDGKFYFGGINGFNCFYPQDLNALKNEIVPPVEITGLQLLKKSEEEEKEIQVQLNKKEKITLPYNRSSFTISYISLSFLSQTKNQYAYKLEGADKEWVYAGNNKNVTYVNLSPGNYRFRVKASNNSGVWNEEGANIQISILPPFWWSLTAKVLYFALIIMLLYILLYYYSQKSKKKQAKQLEIFKAEQENLAYKSKIEFFTNIAHEIRTPVSLIKAPLEEVITLGEGGEETRQNLSIIDKNCNRLSILIDQLLDFRKMDSTEYTLKPERINLREYMNELYERFRKTASSNKIEFILDIPPDLDIVIVSDSDVLTKIVGNLLTNAIKYTKDKILLTLIVNPDNSYTISVEDNGEGIPDELKNMIFDPFYQIQAHKGKTGTGIGLSLVKRLAKLFDGKVTVQNGSVTGSIFSFTFFELPEDVVALRDVPDKEQSIASDMDNEIMKGPKRSILVVDDNPDITLFIKNCLQNDYLVDTVLNANNAWELLEQKGYDLIITDIMMPDIDGISFTKSIKADLNYNHIPVILLSARTENAVKIEGLRSGAEVFIEKPFSTSFLKAQILSLLENRKTILEAFNRSPLASYSMLATNKGDEIFLNKLNEEIEKNLSDENFSVESLTDVLGVSRSNLQRKLKGICGVTPGDYLRNYRLKKACKLLLEGELRINEVAFYVGFSSPSYFTKVFIKCYNMSPREFIQKNTVS